MPLDKEKMKEYQRGRRANLRDKEGGVTSPIGVNMPDFSGLESRIKELEARVIDFGERLTCLEESGVASRTIPGRGLRGTDVRVDKADLFRRVMAEKEKRFGNR